MTNLKLHSEVGKEKWDLLLIRLEDAQNGIDRNKRCWLYRNTPINFETQNEKIEVKSWIKGLFDSCQLFLPVSDLNDLFQFYEQKIPTEMVKSCVMDGIKNRLEEAGILTDNLERRMSSIQEHVEECVLQRRATSDQEDEEHSNKQDKKNGDVEGEEVAEDGEEEEEENDDIDGFEYFKKFTKICLDSFEEVKMKFGPKMQDHIKFDKYAVHSWEDKHAKRTMEDRMIVIDDLGGYIGKDKYNNHSYYGIFDGHQSHEAAAFLRTYSPFVIGEIEMENMKEILVSSLEDIDQAFLSKSTLEGMNSGSTALIVVTTRDTLHYAWLGDCEVHLIDENWNLVPLVKPHKLSDPDEQEKVKAKGGIIKHNEDTGMYRLNGQLAVSRSIGDLLFKDAMILEPSVGKVDTLKNVKFIVMACDGIFDVIQKEELPQLIKKFSETEGDKENLAKSLIKESKERRTEDNLSAIVVEIMK